MEKILEFIQPELFILIAVIFALGMFLKLYPKFTQEWQIPFILLGISIILTILYVAVVLGNGFSAAVIIAAFIQGVLIAASAVFGNELIKQFIKKRKVDNS